MLQRFKLKMILEFEVEALSMGEVTDFAQQYAFNRKIHPWTTVEVDLITPKKVKAARSRKNLPLPAAPAERG